MNEEDKNKRIQQMCNFIIQEAKEKVNEIKLKTENDFALEKQMLIHNAKLRLQNDFKQAEKDVETQKRISKAKSETQSRTKLMFERERIAQLVKEESLKKLEKVSSNSAEYSEVLKKLIIQGLIKMNESNVTVLCREVDLSLVKTVSKEAEKEYKKLIKEETGQDCSTVLTVNPNGQSLDNGIKKCNGGVKLLSSGGRLVLDNTLESRIEIAYEQLMPEIRSALFTTKV